MQIDGTHTSNFPLLLPALVCEQARQAATESGVLPSFEPASPDPKVA